MREGWTCKSIFKVKIVNSHKMSEYHRTNSGLVITMLGYSDRKLEIESDMSLLWVFPYKLPGTHARIDVNKQLNVFICAI